MIEYFRQLFAYDGWAVSESLSSLQEPGNSEARLMLSHILSAEKIWLLRLRGEDSWGVKVFEEFTLKECARLSDELHREYRAYLDLLTEDSLDTILAYKNTKGVEFRTSIKDILTHVAFHGAYHRGQIALLVRQGGGRAVPTDHINFTRL